MLFVVWVFCSCNNYHLAKDYYYLPVDESIDVGYPYGSIIYKSDREYAFENTIVYTDVKECVSDDKYILVYQKPNKAIFAKELEDNLKNFNSYFVKTKKDTLIELPHGKVSIKDIYYSTEKNGNNASKIANSLINDEPYYQNLFSNKFNYWIICLSNDSLIGPLTKDEYFIKRKEMNIPVTLKLKDVF